MPTMATRLSPSRETERCIGSTKLSGRNDAAEKAAPTADYPLSSGCNIWPPLVLKELKGLRRVLIALPPREDEVRGKPAPIPDSLALHRAARRRARGGARCARARPGGQYARPAIGRDRRVLRRAPRDSVPERDSPCLHARTR